MRRILTFATALTGAMSFACADVSSDPDEPFQIAFDTLPSPSVVAGDTMRDTLGRAARLSAEVYNASEELLEDAEVVFIPTARGSAVETVNDVLPGGYVIGRADSVTDQVQIVAQAGRLQSVTRSIDVVRAPSVLRAEGSTILDLGYRADADTTSGNLRVRVGYDSAGTFRGVKSWLVRFRIAYPAVAPDDTAAAVQLVADSASIRRAGLDTTAADGLALRAVRIRPAKLGGATDSVVVEARATYRTDLIGSPVRLVVRYAPAP